MTKTLDELTDVELREAAAMLMAADDLCVGILRQMKFLLAPSKDAAVVEELRVGLRKLFASITETIHQKRRA